MIEAVVFDCFGVLASEGLVPFLKEYFGQQPGLLQEALDLSKQVDAGLFDYNESIKKLAAMAHISEEKARSQIEHNIPDEELFVYIRDKLKPRYKIGLLSNAANNWLDEIFEPWQVALFDEIVLSYQTGFVKPDPRAFQVIADKLGLEPSACILVDDQPRYIEGAKDIGMQGIWYQSLEQMKLEFRRLLV